MYIAIGIIGVLLTALTIFVMVRQHNENKYNAEKREREQREKERLIQQKEAQEKERLTWEQQDKQLLSEIQRIERMSESNKDNKTPFKPRLISDALNTKKHALDSPQYKEALEYELSRVDGITIDAPKDDSTTNPEV